MDEHDEIVADGVVKVIGPNSAGTGFVASWSGLIVTCAHLLAGCDRGDVVKVVPHATGQQIPAVIELLLDPPDVAVLQLLDRMPDEVAVLPVSTHPAERETGCAASATRASASRLACRPK